MNIKKETLEVIEEILSKQDLTDPSDHRYVNFGVVKNFFLTSSTRIQLHLRLTIGDGLNKLELAWVKDIGLGNCRKPLFETQLTFPPYFYTTQEILNLSLLDAPYEILILFGDEYVEVLIKE